MKVIKVIIYLNIFLACSRIALAQQIPFETGCWVTQKQVEILNKTKNVFDYRQFASAEKPIRSIIIENSNILVEAYDDEYWKTQYTFIDKNKLYLKNVAINLAPYLENRKMSTSVVYVKSKYYLYRTIEKNRMYLIVEKPNKSKDTISFTRFINSCPIMSDQIVGQKLIVGSFGIYDNNNKVIENQIVINCNGHVFNSNFIKLIILKDAFNDGIERDTTKDNFYVDSELQTNRLKRDQVILKFTPKSIFIYENYKGRLGKLLYSLKRI
jgi:hypothetical protein